MAGNRETRNLGLIQAIYKGINPPLNITILWYDDNPGQKIHKYYDVVSATWIPLAGIFTATVNGIFTYIAYATDCEGTDFSLVLQPESTHVAILTSITPISSPTQANFNGRWVRLCAITSSTPTYTYVRYADDRDGLNLSTAPVYETVCEECTWVDSFTEKSKIGNWNLVASPGGITINFNGLVIGNYLTIDLKELGLSIPNFTGKYFQVTQSDPFASNLNAIFDISTDPSSSSAYQFTGGVAHAEDFIAPINGSAITLQPSTLNSNVPITGSIYIKIGKTTCQSPPTQCYACRKFMAILVSPTALSDLEIVPAIFEGLWIPISGGCGCSDSDSTIENFGQQLANLRAANENRNNATDSLLAGITNSISYNDLQRINGDQALQNQINDLETNHNDDFDSLQLQITDNQQASSTNASEILAIQNTLTSANIMTLINTQLENKINSFIGQLSSDVNSLDVTVQDHETRITDLETP